mgnify:FL=1|jgi:hypothetical protein|tara:strand:- start:1596 stop:2273 length:678 start_codon:yes stop_codon:yes gene_type:complete
MPTLNANRVGEGDGVGSSSFSTARTGNAGSVADNPSGNDQFAIQHFFSAGRGGGTHKFRRIFIHFDTSSISVVPSGATLNIRGHSAGNDADVILLKSTAMSGDGSTALAASEFFSSIDYSTPYSAEVTTWNLSANNAITLNSTALSDISSNDNFTVAVVEYDSDAQNTATSDSVSAGVDYSTTIFIDFTPGASGYGHKVSGVASGSIAKVNTVATANIGKVNTVD